MKTTQKQLTPEQFIQICIALGGNPSDAVSVLTLQAYPRSWREVAAVAEEMATDLPCCDKNAPRHAQLMLIAQWCEEQVR